MLRLLYLTKQGARRLSKSHKRSYEIHIENLKKEHRIQLTRLEQIRDTLPATEPVSLAIAQRMCRLSQDIRKRIGLLVDSRGKIAKVIVGDHRSIIVPRLRGRDRLKNFRLIHTHIKPLRKTQANCPQILDQDDLFDLVLLQMDATTGLLFDPQGAPHYLQTAYLAQPNDLGYAMESSHLFSRIAKTATTASDFGQSLQEYKSKNRYRDRQMQADANRALLVGVYTERMLAKRNSGMEESISELRELCQSAGFNVIDLVTQKRTTLDPLYLLGKGKARQLSWQAVTAGAAVIVFDLEISAAQARRIEDISDLRVLDRTQVILQIFSKRANSQDGKIQVELAQLRYEKNRLSERDDRRSRLVGGIGTRGPGETIMEIGRRRIEQKIQRFEKKLRKIQKRRQLNRKVRGQTLPSIAIIGYTNAGKSTLLNALTHSHVRTDDALFVTLDPSSRRLRFPNRREIVLIDTVGFTRELPPVLSTAFRAIFEEMQSADLLIHLIDRSDPLYQQKMQAIEENILVTLSCHHIPRLRVFNKIDQVPEALESPEPLDPKEVVCISAKKKLGLSELLAKIDEKLVHDDFQDKQSVESSLSLLESSASDK